MLHNRVKTTAGRGTKGHTNRPNDHVTVLPGVFVPRRRAPSAPPREFNNRSERVSPRSLTFCAAPLSLSAFLSFSLSLSACLLLSPSLPPSLSHYYSIRRGFWSSLLFHVRSVVQRAGRSDGKGVNGPRSRRRSARTVPLVPPSTVPYPRAGEIREPIASAERQRVRRALRNTAAMAVLLHTTSLMCLFTLRKFNWP